MNKLTSDKLKAEFLKFLLWERNFSLGMTEYNNGYGKADVFAITKKMMTWEVEVKITKSDLLSELKTIDFLLERKQGTDFRKLNKLLKHQQYLETYSNSTFGNKKTEKGVYLLPNYFIFFIPEELEAFILPYLKDTPYGAYIFKSKGKDKIKCIKKARKLHKRDLDDSQIIYLAKRLSSENLSLRLNNLKKNK